MSDLGSIFPPRDVWDIAAYPETDVVEGYWDYSPDEIAPGSNRSPGYRWGWLNRRKDVTHEPDGYEGLRYAYIAMSRRPQ